jgi:subtilisin family serine protease
VNSDNVGHGTATAGVIGAATDNGINVASLGWNTKVMPIKLGDNPTVSAEIAGLQYAADNHVPIVNLSVGGPCPVAAEAAAVSAAQSKGVLIVASAGNDALRGDRPSYPAAYPGVLAVGATGFDGTRAAYSNVGTYVDLVAPGGSSDGVPTHNMLLLAPGGGVRTAAGTSFSAPLVSAAAALVRAVDPSITPANIASLLMSTATDLGPPGRDSSYGMGLLNVDAAVVQAATPPPTTAPPTTATTAPPSTASPTTAAPATATTVPAAGRQFQAAVSPVATPQNRMPTFTG